MIVYRWVIIRRAEGSPIAAASGLDRPIHAEVTALLRANSAALPTVLLTRCTGGFSSAGRGPAADPLNFELSGRQALHQPVSECAAESDFRGLPVSARITGYGPLSPGALEVSAEVAPDVQLPFPHRPESGQVIALDPRPTTACIRPGEVQTGSTGTTMRLRRRTTTMEDDLMTDTPESLGGDAIADENILDEAEQSDAEQDIPGIERYEIGFYGTDYPVDALCKRMSSDNDAGAGDIFIPEFQRGYIWTKKQADGFIESLLLGLPVPGIFLSTDRETQRRLVIDGGQRLRTIKSFVDGSFKGTNDYRLSQGVHADFAGRSYADLPPADRRRFDDSVIHATIVSQNKPEDDDRSLFHLFERLNTGGTPATAHEVRRSLWGGSLNELLGRLAMDPHWQDVYGPPSARMKDQELILRFLALHVDETRYGSEGERTMKDFLTSFMARHRDVLEPNTREWSSTFEQIILLVSETLGRTAFRPEGRLNTAVYDAVMVGLANARNDNTLPRGLSLKSAYDQLLGNEEFKEATGSRTSHQPNVKKRLRLAKEAFSAPIAAK